MTYVKVIEIGEIVSIMQFYQNIQYCIQKFSEQSTECRHNGSEMISK